MDRQNLDKILSAVKDLPTIPVVVAQLMTTLNDEKSDAKKVSEIIKNDQSITMKILRLVNSAYFGLSNRVTSVNQAVPLLGFDKIKNIIFTLTIFDTLKNQKGNFNRERFWAHSIGCAVISKMLAQQLGLVNLISISFVCGLIHDIGKVVEDKFFPDEFEDIIRLSASFNLSLCESEKRVLGYDHSFIGCRVAMKWGLPKNLFETILYHHGLPESFEDIEYAGKLVAIVHFADIISKVKRFGSGGDNLIPDPSKQIWELLSLKQEDLGYILENCDEEYKKAEALLELAVD